MTIFFDDIAVGDCCTSTRMTVTQTHIVGFAGLTGDFNPLHMDAEFAKSVGYDTTIAHGMLGHALSTGLRSAIDDWAIMAFLQTQRSFRKPIFAGDTVCYEAEILETRASESKTDRGVVRAAIRLKNQQGTVVQEGEDVFLVMRDTDRMAGGADARS